MGGGACPLLVGGEICLVNSVNERDLNLLTSVTWAASQRDFVSLTQGCLRQEQVCDALRCSGLRLFIDSSFDARFLH